MPVLRLGKDDGAENLRVDSAAPRFKLIDITTPTPPAQEGLRPRTRSGEEESEGRASERIFLAGENPRVLNRVTRTDRQSIKRERDCLQRRPPTFYFFGKNLPNSSAVGLGVSRLTMTSAPSETMRDG